MRQIHLLKAEEIEMFARTPTASKKMYHDGGGLYFRVAKAVGPKTVGNVCCWILRFRNYAGIAREMGLGAYPNINLYMARERAAKAMDMRNNARDPIDERTAERALARQLYIDRKRNRTNDAREKQKVRARLQRQALRYLKTSSVEGII